MSFNGSEAIDNPWETFSSVYTDILGMGFYLIPIGVIAVALYIATRTIAASSIWLMASTLLVGTVIFADYPEMSFIYYLFTVLGLVGVIFSIYMEWRT